MRKTNFPELTKTRKELGLLDQLYTLYADVARSMDDYRNVVWADVVDNIESMTERVEGFSMRCKKVRNRTYRIVLHPVPYVETHIDSNT